MKKRGAGKKVNSNRKKKFFLLNNKVAPVAALILVFVAFAVLLNFVNVPTTGNSITGQPASVDQTTASNDFIQTLFARWQGGNLDVNIAKYLFWIIVLLLLFSGFSLFGFPPGGFLQFLLSLIVSFLATAYITPDEVFSLLAGYSAVGLTLITILPFLGILFFSAALLSNEKLKSMSIGRIMAQLALWGMYAIFLIYKLISGIATGGISLAINLSTIMLSIALIISLLIFVFNPKFRTAIWAMGNQIREARADAERMTAVHAIRTSKEVEEAREGKGRRHPGGRYKNE